MEHLEDIRSDPYVNRSTVEDVTPTADVTRWEGEDVKPDASILASISDSEDVRPVVKGEEPDSLEDEKPCIEALRASVVMTNENVRQRGSSTLVTASDIDVDNTIRSLGTGYNTDGDYTSLISVGNSGCLSPSLILECIDVKEEETEACEVSGHTDCSEISQPQGPENHNAALKEEQVPKEQDSRDQIPQAVLESCESGSVSAVERSDSGQPNVTPGGLECLWRPDVDFHSADNQRHMKQAHNDECVKTVQEPGWRYVSSSRQQSSLSVASLENSVTFSSVELPNSADCPSSQNTLSFGENLFRCDVCGKGFEVREGLFEHKRTHAGEKPYKCDVCGKSFGQRRYLVDHERSHTGEKPYKCDLCDKRFRYPRPLLCHRTSHTGEKPFKCDVCGKGFNYSNHLAKHKRDHRGEKAYLCEVCGKAFGYNSNILSHKRSHTVEKPYKCDVCGKSFKQSRSLVCHKRTHTGEKPTKMMCGKGSSSKTTLLSHSSTVDLVYKQT